MTKIIEVQDCRDCPMRQVERITINNVWDYRHKCNGIYPMKIIPDMSTIPDWCPLPDKKVTP
jgi:hypothetical protein